MIGSRAAVLVIGMMMVSTSQAEEAVAPKEPNVVAPQPAEPYKRCDPWPSCAFSEIGRPGTPGGTGAGTADYRKWIQPSDDGVLVGKTGPAEWGYKAGAPTDKLYLPDVGQTRMRVEG